MSSYDRALVRILGKNAQKHYFVKDLRNFLNHFQIVEPSFSIQWSEDRIARLYTKAEEFLFSGYDWKRSSKEFLITTKEIEFPELAGIINRDVGRVIKFHGKLAARRLKKEKNAFDTYKLDRQRHKHLQKAIIDIDRVFRPSGTPLLKRLFDEPFIEAVGNSALSNDEVVSLLRIFADRYKNLSVKVLEELDVELSAYCSARKCLDFGGAFLDGCKVE